MNNLTYTYKDHEIEFNDLDETWRVDVHAKERSFPKLAEAKEAVDASLKVKYIPEPVFDLDLSTHHLGKKSPMLTQGMATRPAAESGYSFEKGIKKFWFVKDGDKGNQRSTTGPLFYRSPENLKIAAAIMATKAEIIAAEKEIDRMLKTLTPVKELQIVK
jgi:hypothetical protein